MSVSRAALGLGLISALLATLAGGCSIKNPDFCCSSDESCALAGVGAVVACSDRSQPVCDDDGTMGGPAHSCIPDPGTTSCTGPADCATPARPVCDVDETGTCVGCSVGDDCDRFAATPLCDTGSRACVACLGNPDCAAAAAPVCGADHTCRACADDGECASGVCTAVGSCPAAADVIYVDAAAPAANVECTIDAPCSTIAGGLAKLSATRKYMKLTDGIYSEQVILDGRAVEIHTNAAEVTTSQNPVVVVRNGATLTVIGGLRIRGGQGRGLDCNTNATAILRGITLDSHFGRGIEAIDCTLTLDRARVLRNFAGGLQITRGRTTIRNSFIGKNGSAMAFVGGVSISEPIDLTLEFSTIADNTVSPGIAAGLICQTAATVTVANNIIVGTDGNQVAAATCAPVYTLSNQQLPGATNLRGTPTFVNIVGSDYHLAAGSAGIDQADPVATVTVDIDGESRPNGPRADLGADELR